MYVHALWCVGVGYMVYCGVKNVLGIYVVSGVCALYPVCIGLKCLMFICMCLGA